MRKTKGTDEKINFIKSNNIQIDKIADICNLSPMTISNYIGNDGKNKSITQTTRRNIIKGFNSYILRTNKMLEEKYREIDDLHYLLSWIKEKEEEIRGKENDG